MVGEAKNSSEGVMGEHTGYVDQPEAQLFDPQPPPGTLQMSILEEFDQVVGKKLELEKDRVGQEFFREDMVEGITFFEFPDEVFCIGALPVEAENLVGRPIGVGDTEAIGVFKLRKESFLFVSFADHHQPVGRFLFFRTNKMEGFSHFFLLSTSSKPFPMLYSLDYLEDRLRFPAGYDKVYGFSISIVHELGVVASRIRAQQDFELRKMLVQVVVDFPHQAQVVRLRSRIPGTKHRKNVQAHPGHPHLALNKHRVDIQYHPPELTEPQSSHHKPHPTLGQTMNVPLAQPPGKLCQRVRPGKPFHTQQCPQARISPQKINVRQAVASLDDHLKKRKNLGRDRIATIPPFQMRKTKLQMLVQSDISSKAHQQGQTARGGDFSSPEGSEFEILNVLAYHENTSWGFTWMVKSLCFFNIISILPVFWGNRGFFFYPRINLFPVIRISGRYIH